MRLLALKWALGFGQVLAVQQPGLPILELCPYGRVFQVTLWRWLPAGRRMQWKIWAPRRRKSQLQLLHPLRLCSSQQPAQHLQRSLPAMRHPEWDLQLQHPRLVVLWVSVGRALQNTLETLPAERSPSLGRPVI